MASLLNTNGTANDDEILASTGTVDGNDGADILSATNTSGTVNLTGGNGIDTVNFAATTVNGSTLTPTQGVVVDLLGGTATNSVGGDLTLNTIENVIATSFDDTIIGDNNANIITLGGGSDLVLSLDGNDTIKATGVTGSDIDGGDHTYTTAGGGDTLDYSASNQQITIDTGTGRATNTGVADSLEDVFSNIENFVTSKAGTTITLESSATGAYVRSIITHTTNIDATGAATGAAGNGGADTINNFQVGSNKELDGSMSANTRFDIIDLSKMVVPVSAPRTNYIRAEQVDTDGNGSLDAIRIRVSASGALTNTPGAVDETSITLNGLTYANLNSAYGISSVTNSESAITALLAYKNLLLGTDRGAPVVNLPQDQKVTEGGVLVFDGVDTITVSDILTSDGMANNGSNLVTVVAELRTKADTTVMGAGKLTLGGTLAATMTDLDQTNGSNTGDNTNKITLVGTVAQVNAALANLTYTAVVGNNSADEVLRITATDNDGKVAVLDANLLVQASVQNAARLTAVAASQMLNNGTTQVDLQLTMHLPPATGVGSADADGSESYSLSITGVPAGATLVDNSASGATLTNTLGVYTITGTSAQVNTAAASLRITGLTNADYPLSIVATAITLDTDLEGDNATSNASVVLSIDSFSTDVVGTSGVKTIGTNKSEQVIGLDSQADQIAGGSGADVIKGFTTTDNSKQDLADYSVAATGDAITTGVKVNLQSGRGSFGHAEGDTYVGIEGAIGTNFADTFTARAGQRNIFSGGLGNDMFLAKLSTLGNNTQFDTFQGGAGSDTLSLRSLPAGPTTVDLRKASQDFNGDGTIDASLGSIENVATSNNADTITLLNAAGGNVNSNTVFVNRLDNGDDVVINFDSNSDILDLSGVLRTAKSADLFAATNPLLRLSAGATSADTKISVDKNRDGVVDTTITLQGLASNTWSNASNMNFSGKLVANGLVGTLATATHAQTTANVVGGRQQVFFDVDQGTPTFAGGEVFSFTVGGSSVSYTAAAADATWAGVATKIANAINASTQLDGTATASGTRVTFTLNSLKYAELDQIDASRTVGSTTVDLVTGGLSAVAEVSAVEESINTDHTAYTLHYGSKVVDAASLDQVSLTYNGTTYSQTVTTGNLTGALDALATAFNTANPATSSGIRAGRSGTDLVVGGVTPYVLDFANSGTTAIYNNPALGIGTASDRYFAAVRLTIGSHQYWGVTTMAGNAAFNTMKYDDVMNDVVTKINAAGLYNATWISNSGQLLVSNVSPTAAALTAADVSVSVAASAAIASALLTPTATTALFVSVNYPGAGLTALSIPDVQPGLQDILRQSTGFSALTFTQIANGTSGFWSGMGGFVETAEASKTLPLEFDDSVSAQVRAGAANAILDGSTDTTAAVATVRTVTLAGTVLPGDIYGVTINGQTFTVTAAVSDTMTTLATSLATAINADTRGVDGIYQVALDPATTWAVGDIYTIDIGGTAVSLTVTGAHVANSVTATYAVRDAMVSAIKDANITGVIASAGGSENLLVITSTDAAKTITTQYTDSTLAVPAAVSTTATDVATVQEWESSADALVTATSSGAVLTLTSKSAGADLLVSAVITPGGIDVLDGSQFFEAYSGTVDRFVWQYDAISGNDTIRGFTLGEDKLDLRNVFTTSGVKTNYLTVTDATSGGNVVVTVDSDGSAITTTDQFSITLNAVGTGALTLNSLINNGTLMLPGTLS